MKGVSLLNNANQKENYREKSEVNYNIDTIFRYVRRNRRFPLRP